VTPADERPALDLPLSSGLSVALVHPQIAPNTGNIARLCVATGTPLHLVRPLGFTLADHQLKRSAMDYWPRLKLTLHDDLASFLDPHPPARCWYFDSAGTRSIWDATFTQGDTLVFGSETKGLPESLTAANPDRLLRLPQVPGERCLNLSSSVAAALYEALRQLHTAAR
jgi:tRNA (cytidine/uridine-2'-O-)-methyltransferase